MLGYQYFIEQDAINARKECADYYGLPKSPEDETIYWVNYDYSELNFWYIIFDESIEAILGKPTNFEI
jgi:hypothetical protein